MLVLGIDVSPEQVEVWRGWLMPERQPFIVPRDYATQSGSREERDKLTAELADSFLLYGLAESETIVWLSRAEAHRLPQSLRQAQRASHRWPSQNASRDIERVIRAVENGRRPSRHHDVTAAQWAHAQTVLPGARALTGQFPARSGPNCFGTVMAAAGVQSAATEWTQIAPFER